MSEGEGRVSGAIADIESVMRQTGCLAVPGLPHEVERVIATQLGHFFDLGQMVAREMLLDLKSEMARMEAKIDMMIIDARADRREIELLRAKLEVSGGAQ